MDAGGGGSGVRERYLIDGYGLYLYLCLYLHLFVFSHVSATCSAITAARYDSFPLASHSSLADRSRSWARRWFTSWTTPGPRAALAIPRATALRTLFGDWMPALSLETSSECAASGSRADSTIRAWSDKPGVEGGSEEPGERLGEGAGVRCGGTVETCEEGGSEQEQNSRNV